VDTISSVLIFEGLSKIYQENSSLMKIKQE